MTTAPKHKGGPPLGNKNAAKPQDEHLLPVSITLTKEQVAATRRGRSQLIRALLDAYSIDFGREHENENNA